MEVKIGMRTPWGRATDVLKIGNGIWLITTARGGGCKLDVERNGQMPEAVRNKAGWYSDREMCLVVIRFPWVFIVPGLHHAANESKINEAHRLAKDYFPEKYTAITGREVEIHESELLRKRLFEQENHNRFVASYDGKGDWYPEVPDGMVEVVASSPGQRMSVAFLVPSDEFDQPREFGFVIDEARHMRA